MPRVAPGLLEPAIGVFIEGFCFTRSFTHPYSPTKIGPIHVLRDGPRKTKAPPRRDEWVAAQTAPETVDQLARKHSPGRFCLSIITADLSPNPGVVAAYKALQYRLAASEAVMVHPLQRIPRVSSPATIRRVLTPTDADRLAKAAGQRHILPEHLHRDAPLRQYLAEIDGEIVGWVRSICCARGNWHSNLFVLPRHRRKRVGSALLARLLRDDRAQGAKLAVLTASHAGAKLYPTLGYRPIGTMLLFTPQRQKDAR